MNTSKTHFIVLSIVITIVASFLLSYIYSLFTNDPTHPDYLDDSAISLFFWVVLVAPFFETVFFQAAIIEFLMFHLKVRIIIIPILISGLIFGGIHYFVAENIFYILVAIPMGFVFATIRIGKKKKGY